MAPITPVAPPPQQHLLLLPPAPSTSVSTLTSIFLPYIASAVRDAPADGLLYAALIPPFSTRSRHASFGAAQQLLGALYGIIYRATEDEKRHDVDVRVLFIQPDGDADATADTAVDGEATAKVLGPVVPLVQLLGAREWAKFTLVTLRHEAGAELKLQMSNMGLDVERLVIVDASEAGRAGESGGQELEKATEGTKEFRYIAVGGTFDHLHLGHKLLLTSLAYLCSPTETDLHLVVGISGPAMLAKKGYALAMESWTTRADRTIDFLQGILLPLAYGKSTPDPEEIPQTHHHDMWSARQTLKAEVVELSDPFGPTITVEGIEALVVTEETKEGGEAINLKRQERGWRKLEVLTVGLVMKDGVEKMSSTELRKREVEEAAE